MLFFLAKLCFFCFAMQKKAKKKKINIAWSAQALLARSAVNRVLKCAFTNKNYKQ
jgi:hypothetical protein